VSTAHTAARCLSEDELLELAAGARSLADDAGVEAHLASCSSGGSLLAQLAGGT
jgi:hypothetical protein